MAFSFPYRLTSHFFTKLLPPSPPSHFSSSFLRFPAKSPLSILPSPFSPISFSLCVLPYVVSPSLTNCNLAVMFSLNFRFLWGLNMFLCHDEMMFLSSTSSLSVFITFFIQTHLFASFLFLFFPFQISKISLFVSCPFLIPSWSYLENALFLLFFFTSSFVFWPLFRILLYFFLVCYIPSWTYLPW